MTQKSASAFSLLEIIVVVLILSTIAGLAYVGYTKTLRLQIEKQLVQELQAFDMANQAYKAKHGRYWVPSTLIGQPSGTCDTINALPFQPDPTIKKIVLQLYNTQTAGGATFLDDFYVFRNFGKEYYFILYNRGRLLTNDLIVSDGYYTEPICCNGGNCLTLPQCVPK